MKFERKSKISRIIKLSPRLVLWILYIATVASLFLGYLTLHFQSNVALEPSITNARPRIGAYYYAWYEPKQWEQWKTKYHPQLGLYQSQDSNVLTNHSQWAQQAGIDFFVMSWSDPANQDSILRYLQHPSTIPIALHIESLMLYWDSRVNRTRPNNGQIDFEEPCHNFYTKRQEPFGNVLINYLTKIMDDFVLPYRDKYIFAGNRPVFVLYLAREFVNFDASMHELKRIFAARYGVEPYLIADVVWFQRDKLVRRNTKNAGLHLWNAITAYNRFEGRKHESLEDYMNRMQEEYDVYANPTRSWWNWNPRIRIPVVPYVQPGYDDLLIRSDEHGQGLDRPIYERDGGTTYHKFWDMAQRLLDRNPCDAKEDSSFVFITSFNEWHESTSIEPSVEWGDHYVQITRDRVKALRSSCDASVSRPSLVWPLQ